MTAESRPSLCLFLTSTTILPFDCASLLWRRSLQVLDELAVQIPQL